MDAFQDYQHEPLLGPDGLRILVLDPAVDSSAVLQGSIIQIRRFDEIVRTNHHQRYSAVSYTWGDPNFCEDLCIHSNDDSTPSSRLKITPTVKGMLSHLRKAYKSRSLWIDAICLNQVDSIEKAQQIPLMGEIYSQADKVHIWLGPDDGDETARVFSLLRLIALSPEPVDIDNAVSFIFSDHDSASRHIGRFFDHSWFFRRWILQEAALSKYGIVLCGASRIAYPVFVEACRRLQNSVHGRNKYAIETTMALAKDRSTREIFNLLWLFHRSRCHEKRDRIVALYGFIPHQKQLLLDSNTTHTSLYKKHAVWLIENSREHEMSLHLFHFGPLPVQPGSAKAEFCNSSWIPDWSNQRDQSLPVMTGFPAPSSPEFDSSKLVSVAALLFQDWHKRQPVSKDRICSSWRRFLFEDFTETVKQFYRLGASALAPYTLFASDEDEAGRHVLNVRWINPWAGAYGQSITQAVAIPELPNTWMDVAGSFHAFFDGDSKEVPREINLERLSRLIESVMSQRHCHSLRHWEADDRPAVVKQAITLMATTEAYQEPKLFPQHVDMLLETLQNIILDLGILIHQCQWAIVEILGTGKKYRRRPFFDYAFGPSSINKSTLLIPMASRLPGTFLNPGQAIWYEKVPEKTQSIKVSAAFSTMIAVQPLDPSFGNPPITDRILERDNKVVRKESWAASLLPPVKTKYLGPCLAIIATTGDQVKNFETSHTAGRDWWHSMAETYFDAELQGLPVPFTVDIV